MQHQKKNQINLSHSCYANFWSIWIRGYILLFVTCEYSLKTMSAYVEIGQLECLSMFNFMFESCSFFHSESNLKRLPITSEK